MPAMTESEIIESLLKRVGALEAEVARLRATPPAAYHYHYGPPLYGQPYYSPLPTWGHPHPYIVCGGGAGLTET